MTLQSSSVVVWGELDTCTGGVSEYYRKSGPFLHWKLMEHRNFISIKLMLLNSSFELPHYPQFHDPEEIVFHLSRGPVIFNKAYGLLLTTSDDRGNMIRTLL
jgi:hypothetical protein